MCPYTNRFWYKHVTDNILHISWCFHIDMYRMLPQRHYLFNPSAGTIDGSQSFKVSGQAVSIGQHQGSNHPRNTTAYFWLVITLRLSNFHLSKNKNMIGARTEMEKSGIHKRLTQKATIFFFFCWQHVPGNPFLSEASARNHSRPLQVLEDSSRSKW